MIRLALFLLAAAVAAAAPALLPTPQYREDLARALNGPFSVVVEQRSAKMDLAGKMLRDALPQGSGSEIHLWDYQTAEEPPIELNFLDRETLRNPEHWGQSYVLRFPDDGSVWVVGASEQGTLYGVATLLQLYDGGSLHAAYVRDQPDFELRAAADWLLNIEINGWTHDRGQGVEAFARTVEAKLDRAVRYKVNMAAFDGFGFSLEKRPAWYPELMLRLNRYARARGVHLLFGGYGASYGMAYEPVVMYENGAGFMGTVFENRESYPDGPKYRCMGFPKMRKGYDPATLGSCRSNDALNALKADELRAFVEATEPGALYIHHEDFGGFEGTQKAWLDRCDRCRRRWPNDSLAARDGGAGALAHGYAAFVRAVAGVKNAQSGYDGARDCEVILISPVYIPDEQTSESWSNVLELWRNIAVELPRVGRVQAGFREVWPLQGGGARWTETFDQVMQAAGAPLRMFLFFTGGADRFVTDYPLTGAPAMNALFQGAASIYDASGDSYQEPMELINAEYSWNVRSEGFYSIPRTADEAHALLRRYAYQENQPSAIFGEGGLYERACRLLYGDRAAEPMMAYYRLSAELPDAPPAELSGRPMTWLPATWDRAYAAPPHWRHLVQDSYTWSGEVRDESLLRAIRQMGGIENVVLHRRLAARWRTVARLNSEGRALIGQALAAGPNKESVEDLKFLQRLLETYQPLTEALADLHTAIAEPGSSVQLLRQAGEKAREAERMAHSKFPEPIDPVGGEIGALRRFSTQLTQAIAARSEKR